MHLCFSTSRSKPKWRTDNHAHLFSFGATVAHRLDVLVQLLDIQFSKIIVILTCFHVFQEFGSSQTDNNSISSNII